MDLITRLAKRRKLLTLNELARLFGVTRGTVHKYVKERRIPYRRIGIQYRFDPRVVAAWLRREYYWPDEKSVENPPSQGVSCTEEKTHDAERHYDLDPTGGEESQINSTPTSPDDPISLP